MNDEEMAQLKDMLAAVNVGVARLRRRARWLMAYSVGSIVFSTFALWYALGMPT